MKSLSALSITRLNPEDAIIRQIFEIPADVPSFSFSESNIVRSGNKQFGTAVLSSVIIAHRSSLLHLSFIPFRRPPAHIGTTALGKAPVQFGGFGDADART